MSPETILAALLSLPPAVYPRGLAPETAAEREARLRTVAVAIDTAAREATCEHAGEGACVRVWPGEADEAAALLVSIAWFESKLMLHVHQDRCRRDECDAYVTRWGVVHRARSLWQVQSSRVVPASLWRQIGGTGLRETTMAARAALLVLGAAESRCHAGLVGAVSGYATGRLCSWRGAWARIEVAKRVRPLVVGSGS